MKLSVVMNMSMLLVGGVLVACAADRVPPKALTDAREDFTRVHDGIASQWDPTDLHEADLAMQRAEAAWRNDPDDPSTVDLALVAQRKSRLAQAEAEATKAQQDTKVTLLAIQSARAAQLDSAKQALGQTRQALGATEMQLEDQRATTAAQAQKLQDMEARLKDARDTIAKIATVKDDDRGMVITLQGEVLFQTAKFDLKPSAMAKLDQIAKALEGKEQPIVVYGFTDTVGTPERNMTLSQNRAQAVRDYLVSKGLPKDLLTAQGKGQEEPVADNASIEGRAQNRRVEIVVKPKP